MRLRQHLPAYYDPFTIGRQVVDDWDGNPDSVPWLGHWRERASFHRFSASDTCLVVELWGGYEWWVVGHHEGGEPDLPAWKAPPQCHAARRLQVFLRALHGHDWGNTSVFGKELARELAA